MCTADSDSPVVATYGYSRARLPGIPGKPGDAAVAEGASVGGLPPVYHLYVAVRKGAAVSSTHAWVAGRYYGCRLVRVVTPVKVGEDPVVPSGMQVTLVPARVDDVYEVVLGDADPARRPTSVEQPLVSANDVVIALMLRDAVVPAVIRSLQALKPSAGM